ncbi:hypothetical protein SARC_16287, partial [Sphaeroforma arctica JP610]
VSTGLCGLYLSTCHLRFVSVYYTVPYRTNRLSVLDTQHHTTTSITHPTTHVLSTGNSERYPCISQVINDDQIPVFDNLYLDMNGIIHNCSHGNSTDPNFQ